MCEIKKDLLQRILELQKKNIELHKEYCEIIIADASLKDWERQHMIDVLSGVQFGSDIPCLEDNLQLSKHQIKNHFKSFGLCLDEKKRLWRQE